MSSKKNRQKRKRLQLFFYFYFFSSSPTINFSFNFLRFFYLSIYPPSRTRRLPARQGTNSNFQDRQICFLLFGVSSGKAIAKLRENRNRICFLESSTTTTTRMNGSDWQIRGKKNNDKAFMSTGILNLSLARKGRNILNYMTTSWRQEREWRDENHKLQINFINVIALLL